MPVVKFLKSGNRLVVDTADQAVINKLTPLLCYTALKFLYGEDRKIRGRSMEYVPMQCYMLDVKHRIGTSWGLYHRLTVALAAMGYTVEIIDLAPHLDPSVFEPYWDRLYDGSFDLRHRQDEFLIKMLSRPCGRFDCPTGYGKTMLIGLLATILPKAVIHVVADSVPVLRDRMLPELCGMLPDVGLFGGGSRQSGRRVQLYTVDSLRHSDFKADILIGDECQQLAPNFSASMLARYNSTRNYGLSATHDMRLDNKDLRVEAMFGPLIMSVSYQEAEAHGMVVPIEVRWHNVEMSSDPCTSEDPVWRKKQAVWRNHTRNEVIAGVAGSCGDKAQVLIVCEVIEHVLALRKMLPEFEIVYGENGITPHDETYYRNHGMWPPGHAVMTRERRMALTKAFERGTLRRAIVTTVWNVGVSFNKLQHLIRADAGASPINDTQIPGRVSRLADDKECGVIHDFTDTFNKTYTGRATGRARNYHKHGWTQYSPDGKVYVPAGKAHDWNH